ncbi:2-C-methyl-D-erythritol 4-phosphate cytidylyltransferase [Marinoscillum pacificum]|uniref:2-C-methyl-D-erythritol 4-phosphate cytidylyltransferase n=1 Tax=Marinoscillum pacificum TaxID=392723 RepID=UPI0021576BDD|nr:2-C-methyl-D-erythritol 4-phosphate cytidylyltransferase [Marinoscillum pacificum]
MRKHVIIVAGGSGSRMKQALPKQFIEILGKPIMVHTIEAFLAYDPSIHIVLVLPEAHLPTWTELKAKYLSSQDVSIAFGGATRFQSVKSGLNQVDNGLVAIHDAVRPMISKEVIRSSFELAEAKGSGVVMVPLKDSIREKGDGGTVARDRSLYYAVQTPQTFRVELIKQAFAQEESPLFTDDASVYEASGKQVEVVSGDYRNIKITTPEDLILAEALLKK